MFKLLLNCSLVKTSCVGKKLVRSIRENIRTLVFRTDLTSFGPNIFPYEPHN